jgi:hypothetical protein
VEPASVPYPYFAMPSRIREFAWALADIDRHPDWPHVLHHHLTHLSAALDDHVRATEGERGCYAEVVDVAPRLARGVQLLAREHERLNGALTALWRHADSGASPADLRRCGTDLLVLLTQHRQRGIDLLYEAYGTDIGGET